MIQKHEVSKCNWKNVTDFSRQKVATHLQFVKNEVSVKHGRERSAWILLFALPLASQLICSLLVFQLVGNQSFYISHWIVDTRYISG